MVGQRTRLKRGFFFLIKIKFSYHLEWERKKRKNERRKKRQLGASQVMLVVKNPAANTGNVRDSGLTPGLGRFPGGAHDNPLQYCLGDPMDRAAWWATVHRVARSRARLKQFSRHACKVKLEGH